MSEQPYQPFYKPYGMSDEEYEYEKRVAADKLEQWEAEQREQEIIEKEIEKQKEKDSNLLDAQVSQAVSQAMPEPNSQVCANCKWLADRDGENNYFCNCYESETCDILIILKDTFGCNKFERKLL